MPAKKSYKLKSSLWRYPGATASWHFISLPKKEAAAIKAAFGAHAKGFRSLRVRVTIGRSTWDTSIFPDSRQGTYLLPVKAAVRKKEGLAHGDDVRFTLDIL